MVVGWCSTKTSAANARAARGLSSGSTRTMPLRIMAFLRLRSSLGAPAQGLTAKDADWPARTSSTATDLVWMPLTCTRRKAPVVSGPSMSTGPWPALTAMAPFRTVPATTTPTPGTWKTSSMQNSAFSSLLVTHSRRAGSALRKRRSSGRPSPVTLDTWKMGTSEPPAASWRAHERQPAASRISYGIFLTCLLRRSVRRPSKVWRRTFSGARSTLVTSTKKGRRRASSSPRCSFVMRWTPAFAPTTIAPKSGTAPVSPKTVVLR
mmetsp:Transcript_20292/g.60539  ORF Transcript_20292/g.60539 Transcript_20292/m.60539 type:complete len:264 (-) Transcript_20292:931-1722(-)